MDKAASTLVVCLTCDLAVPELDPPRSARSTAAFILKQELAEKVQVMSNLGLLHHRQVLQACSWTRHFRLTRRKPRTLLLPDTYSP